MRGQEQRQDESSYNAGGTVRKCLNRRFPISCISVTGTRTLRTWGIRAAVVICAIAGLAYGAKKVSYNLAHESTDDAFIEGSVVPISSEVKGKVTKVFVRDNQLVKTGEPLVEIAAEDYTALVQARQDSVSRMTAEQQETHALIKAKTMALARARAELDAVETNAALAEKDLKRSSELRKKEVISQSQYDQAEARSKDALARRASANASVAEIEASIEALNAQITTQKFKIREAGTALNLARIDLGRTTITAPADGRIAKKNVDEGKYVQPGQPLLSIVDDSNLWVVANFKETQIAHMKPGQPVDITVDAYPGVTFAGHVDSFQPGTGAVFSLLPPQNATGNFVKVVQRVPVKIVIDSKPDPAHPLRPGLSVYPSVAIKGTNPDRSRWQAANMAKSDKWIITLTVMIGTIMAALDSSIVNVALPYMRGTLGASVEEITWVATGYILSTVIIMPIVGMLSARYGTEELLPLQHRQLHHQLHALRDGLGPYVHGRLPRDPGHGRRRADPRVPGDPAGDLSRLKNRARPWGSTGSASCSGPPSARPSAAGSRTTIPGPGSFTSTCRSGILNILMVMRYHQGPALPRARKRQDRFARPGIHDRRSRRAPDHA